MEEADKDTSKLGSEKYEVEIVEVNEDDETVKLTIDGEEITIEMGKSMDVDSDDFLFLYNYLNY